MLPALEGTGCPIAALFLLLFFRFFLFGGLCLLIRSASLQLLCSGAICFIHTKHGEAPRMDTCTSRMHSTAPIELRGSRRMRLSYAMQRGIPAGQVAKGGSGAPCFYSRRVGAWVDMVSSYCLDLLSCEPVFRRMSPARRAAPATSLTLFLYVFSTW